MKDGDISETLLNALAEVLSAEVIRMQDYVDRRVDEKIHVHEQRAHPEFRTVSHLKAVAQQMQSQIDETRARVLESRAQIRLVRDRQVQQGHPDHDPGERQAIREGLHRQRAKSQDYTTPLPRPNPLRFVCADEDVTEEPAAGE